MKLPKPASNSQWKCERDACKTNTHKMYVKHSIILFEVGTYSDTRPVNIEIWGGIEPTLNKKQVRTYSVVSCTKAEITSGIVPSS